MRARELVVLVLLVILASALFSAAPATAARKTIGLDGQVRSVGFSKAVPGQLNYQGYLVDAADSVAVNATLGMTFRLFDSEAKGAELWFEAHPAVDVSNGLFQVLLGSVTVFPAGLFDGTTLWLQTEVGAEVLSPRKPLVSVAYSHRSNSAEMLLDNTLVDLDARWVNEDQPSSVTSAMITDGEIVDDDVAVGAAIDPGKIAGTAWTADNDGAGSGLDADLLDGQQAADFISMDDLDHLDAADGDPANAVYVDDAGKVGIGTTTPGEKLQVTGVIHSTTDGFKFPDGTTQTTAATGGAGDGHSLDAADGSPTDVVYVNNAGHVGVGTTNPAAQLDSPGPVRIGNPAFVPAPTAGLLLIANDATSSSFPLIVMNPSGDYILYAKGDGNVGIGTTSPGAKLEVNYDNSSSTSPAIVIDNPHGVGAQDVLDFRFSGSTQARIRKAAGGDMFIGTVVNDGLNLITNGTNRLKVASDGKVGIGTTSPSEELEVVGEVQITSSADKLALDVFSSGFSVSQMVNFETDQDVTLLKDILQIKVPSGSSDGFQFIECERGSDVEFKVNGDGNVYADGSYNTPASDFAEMIAVSSGASTVEPGDVMVIDHTNPRATLKASKPRSTLVAGIYSTRPGFLGSERDWDKPTRGEDGEIGTYTLEEMAREFNEVPLAVVGIVPCKVSAENGQIRPGDLLVTSSTPGHAMRDDNPKVGTVVGKSLGSLASDTGVIKVLVTLH